MMEKGLQLEQYLNRQWACSCGKTHATHLKAVAIRPGAVNEVPEILKSVGCARPFVLYDETTYQAAGELLQSALEGAGVAYTAYILPYAEPVPDEKVLGQILFNFDPACDLLLAIGTGTLNDLAKYVSFKMGKPYAVVATAPSMDGFVSSVAALMENHMKVTYPAHVPCAVIGDTDILQAAPMEMIASGVGDILGKYTCLCDWAMAREIEGEYYCPELVAIMRQAIDYVVQLVPRVPARDPEAIAGVMEALVLSGIAMAFAGNSRPASGSEHHLSHYWELQFLAQERKAVLHGIKVGIGTVAVLRMYEWLFARKIDFEAAKAGALAFDEEAWRERMRALYGEGAQAVLDLEAATHKNGPEAVGAQLDAMAEKWDTLRKIAAQLPPSGEIARILQLVGAPVAPQQVGVDKQMFADSVVAAKELRNRFGLLQMLFDLNLSRQAAQAALEGPES